MTYEVTTTKEQRVEAAVRRYEQQQATKAFRQAGQKAETATPSQAAANTVSKPQV